MKLLLVDDNERIRKMMLSIYSTHFEEIIECSDGIEAVSLYEKSKPDWVVMDIKMKVMDGLEATASIISLNPHAKVIIVSQYEDNTTIQAAMNAGAVEFVSKSDLYKVIDVIKR
ncbi:MAG: response regulator transcription factor [Ignavibacteriales bacterium]|nr:MAG: response regulator transcription factor [Ignavibacteriales bacterium]